MGTVELTGLEITKTKALGAVVAMPVARSRTIPALIYRGVSEWGMCMMICRGLTLKRSSLHGAKIHQFQDIHWRLGNKKH